MPNEKPEEQSGKPQAENTKANSKPQADESKPKGKTDSKTPKTQSDGKQTLGGKVKDKLAGPLKNNPAMAKLQKIKRTVKQSITGSKAGLYGIIMTKFINAAQMLVGFIGQIINQVTSWIGMVLMALGKVGAAIGAFFSSAGAVIGGLLGVGATVGTAIISIITACFGFGTVGAAAIILSNSTGQRDIGVIADCLTSVSHFGSGDGQIPETVGKYHVGYTTTWEASLSWLDQHIGKGTQQRAVVDMVKTNSHYDKHNFLRFGRYYIVAIAPTPFGVQPNVPAHIGDYITFYLSDGTAIDCIVGDAKGNTHGMMRGGGTYDFNRTTPWTQAVPISTPTGPAVISAYGHVYGDQINVLEFWGNMDAHPRPGNNHFEMITGKKHVRVTSFTNHGYAPEFTAFTNKSNNTLTDTSNSAISLASANSRSDSLDACVKARTYDSESSSNLAVAVASYAYDNTKESEGNDGTPLYRKLHRRIFVNDKYFQSCDRSVAVGVRWSGFDTKFPAGPCTQLIAYMDASERWKMVGNQDNMTSKDLKPGDIVITKSHVCIYVGRAAIQKTHGSKSAPNTNSVSGSLGERSPGVDMSAALYIDKKIPDTRFYYVYRCVHPEHSNMYKSAGD